MPDSFGRMPLVLGGQLSSAPIGQTTVRHPILSQWSMERLAALLVLLQEVFLRGAEDHVLAAGSALDGYHVTVNLNCIGRH